MILTETRAGCEDVPLSSSEGVKLCTVFKGFWPSWPPKTKASHGPWPFWHYPLLPSHPLVSPKIAQAEQNNLKAANRRKPIQPCLPNNTPSLTQSSQLPGGNPKERTLQPTFLHMASTPTPGEELPLPIHTCPWQTLLVSPARPAHSSLTSLLATAMGQRLLFWATKRWFEPQQVFNGRSIHITKPKNRSIQKIFPTHPQKKSHPTSQLPILSSRQPKKKKKRLSLLPSPPSPSLTAFLQILWAPQRRPIPIGAQRHTVLRCQLRGAIEIASQLALGSVGFYTTWPWDRWRSPLPLVLVHDWPLTTKPPNLGVALHHRSFHYGVFQPSVKKKWLLRFRFHRNFCVSCLAKKQAVKKVLDMFPSTLPPMAKIVFPWYIYIYVYTYHTAYGYSHGTSTFKVLHLSKLCWESWLNFPPICFESEFAKTTHVVFANTISPSRWFKPMPHNHTTNSFHWLHPNHQVFFCWAMPVSQSGLL